MNNQSISPEKKSDFSIVRMLATLKDGKERSYSSRYWSPATRKQSYRVFGPLAALDARFQTTPEMVICALYATHFREGAEPHKTSRKSIGDTIRLLGGGNVKADEFPSVEKHFLRLLASKELDDTADQLHRFMIRFRNHKSFLQVDYENLLWDLRRFLSNPEKTHHHWASDFWQAPNLEQPESSSTS